MSSVQGSSNANIGDQSTNKSKPFLKGAIIEEVTKEHFFTRDQRGKAESSQSGSYKTGTPRHAAGNSTTVFQKRSRSLIPQAQRDAQANHEKLKKSIPPECKVICFCTKHELQANVAGLDNKGGAGASGAFNRRGDQSRNAGLSSAMSSSVAPADASQQHIPDGSRTASTIFQDVDSLMCTHSKTTDVNTVYEIVSAQVQSLRATDTSWRAHLEIAGGNLDKVQFVRGANYFRQMSDIIRG